MTVNAMRTYISDTYGTNVIRGTNVYDMADRQVIAIYKSLLNRGTKPKRPDTKTEQLTIFDLMEEKKNA